MHPRPTPLPHRSFSRGFTLLELLIAIVAGLMVSIAAFALSKQGTRFFHQETRLANAQFETVVGFERLRADISRAGYLSTANIQAEPYRCPSSVPSDWPYGLKALAALRIERPPADTLSAANGLQPDRIFLTGSYTSDELFPVRAIVPGAGSGDRIYLNESFGPMRRLLGRATAAEVAADNSEALREIFAPGRAIRVLDQTGGISFGIINDVELEANTTPVIVLQQMTNLPFLREGSRCGIAGNETGAQVSVINWIAYQLEPLTLDDLPSDEGALQLVRRELDFRSEGTENPLYIGAPETVAEFAVDLQFGITHVNGPGLNPVLTTLDLGNSGVRDIARDVTAAGVLGPQHVRAVRTRLSVRSREGDRQETIEVTSGGALYRYKLADEKTYARVRTMGADIFLPNLMEVTW